MLLSLALPHLGHRAHMPRAEVGALHCHLHNHPLLSGIPILSSSRPSPVINACLLAGDVQIFDVWALRRTTVLQTSANISATSIMDSWTFIHVNDESNETSYLPFNCFTAETTITWTNEAVTTIDSWFPRFSIKPLGAIPHDITSEVLLQKVDDTMQNTKAVAASHIQQEEEPVLTRIDSHRPPKLAQHRTIPQQYLHF